MLKIWDKQHPGRLESIFRGLQNIAPSQLADGNWFDFTGLEEIRRAHTDESHAFQSPDPSGRIER
jgi:tRNA 2-thiocytidine biosynthesis protein TtcA